MNIKAIQRRLGLIEDGIDGKATWTAILTHVVGHSVDQGLGRAFAKYRLQYGLNTIERIADFIAQTAHESSGYTRFVENMNYAGSAALKQWPLHFNSTLANWAHRNPERIAEVAYGIRSRTGRGRMGNTAAGDGWKYRGRGILQITGKDNYRTYGRLMGLDLVNQPELAADPENSVLLAMLYYKSRNILPHVDKRDYPTARKLVNGGTIGLAHVNDYRAKAKNLLSTT